MNSNHNTLKHLSQTVRCCPYIQHLHNSLSFQQVYPKQNNIVMFLQVTFEYNRKIQFPICRQHRFLFCRLFLKNPLSYLLKSQYILCKGIPTFLCLLPSFLPFVTVLLIQIFPDMYNRSFHNPKSVLMFCTFH